ncbi:hypothetical protein ACNKHL_07425 [Shigella flexneri]
MKLAFRKQTSWRTWIRLSEDAFDGRCTALTRVPANLRAETILLDTYYGRDYVEGETQRKKKPLRLQPKKSKQATG